jgi:ethanolamine utilization protein EutJ
MTDSTATRRLNALAELVSQGGYRAWAGALKVGVDPGTANIAVVVLDENDNPVAGISHPSRAVKDGVVVDFLTASRVVSGLKTALEERLGCPLTRAATAIPPGITAGNTKVIVNMVEAAGLEVTDVVDEPVAAALALNIRHGAVVDVGGGTTGISILRNGEVIFSADEPTGGNHMTLVLAGALGMPFAEAEALKKSPEEEEQSLPWSVRWLKRWLIWSPAGWRAIRSTTFTWSEAPAASASLPTSFATPPANGSFRRGSRCW